MFELAQKACFGDPFALLRKADRLGLGNSATGPVQLVAYELTENCWNDARGQ